MRKLIIAILLLLCVSAQAATLLPQGRQQFFSANGYPLTGGYVYFYIPNTNTLKDTFKDPGGLVLNTNPVRLDAGGFATIYGTGVYRMVVKDSNGLLLYDQLTADTSNPNESWAGTAGGTANALVLSAPAFAAGNGQSVSWRNSATNTGATTVEISGAIYQLVKDIPTGSVQLTGGELINGGIASAVFNAVTGNMHLVTGVATSPFISVASAATVNLGALASPNVQITGNTTITSFGTAATTAAPLYNIRFTGTVQLTYNATFMRTPTGASLYFKPNSFATVRYLGSGNWEVLDYYIPRNVPTQTRLTATGAGTYTPPPGVTMLHIRMVGGGGGGGGTGGGSPGDGGAGGDTIFNAVIAKGGPGGSAATAGGTPAVAGGTGGTGASALRVAGKSGAGANDLTSVVGAFVGTGTNSVGGNGGDSLLGFGGVGGRTTRTNALPNTGGGGAGASGDSFQIGGGGGGGGEYVEIIVSPVATSYAYTVGAGGTAGAAGATTGAVGGTGGSGLIVVDEFYTP